MEPAYHPASYPVELDRPQICVSELLKQVHCLRSLNRNLREIVRHMLQATLELSRVVAYPIEVFFARSGVNHQQIVVFAQPVNDYVVHKRPLRMKQRRILRLPNRQPRGIVHGNVLYRVQRTRPAQSDVAHVTDIENPDTSANRHVFSDNAAAYRRRIFNRHVPPAELNHLGAQRTMNGIQRSLANLGWNGLNRRQE